MLLDAKSDSPVSLLDPVHRPCEKNKLDKSFSHSQTIWWHNGGMRIITVTNTFTVQKSLSNDRIMKAIEERQSWGPITNGLVVVVIGLKSNFMLGRPFQNISLFPSLAPSGALIAIPTYYWSTTTHPTFSDHIGPQQWTFTFWATTAI